MDFRRIGVLLAALLITTLSFAQKDFTKEAEKSYAGEAYYTAIQLFKRAYAKEQSRAKKAEILYKIGECYRLILDLKQAETWYKKAIKAGYHETEAMVILRLADAIKAQERYDEALTEYQKYAGLKPDDLRGTNGAKSCELAQKWKDAPTRFEVQNEVLLNSKQYDFAPAFADKKFESVLFSSSREGATGDDNHARTGQNHSDIFYSKRDRKGKWSVPVNLNETVNTSEEEGGACMNARYNQIYFTRCKQLDDGKAHCEILTAKKMGQSYGEATLVEMGIDSADQYTFGHPTLSKDGQYLVFASNMPGGQGGKDLWYMKQENKKWGDPVNLGPEINTTGDEMFPFIHPEGTTLYFASDGHLGMGGLDIFFMDAPVGNWEGDVENMQSPINSAGNDFGIIFDGLSKGYFTSDRDGGKGGDDIYSFFVPSLVFTMQGTITNIKSNQPIAGAKIKLEDSDGNTYEATSDETGFYEFAQIPNSKDRYIKEGKTYKIFVSKEEHLNAKGEESTIGLETSTTFVHDFALQKFTADPGQEPVEIEFPEVLYEFAKWDLKPESKDSLDFLYQVLIDNPSIVIELSAHTDSRGGDSYNLTLSQKRAQSCVDYLIDKGIDKRRLNPQGYGESRLLITDKEITQLSTEEEREAGHQKNRRTVFSVVRADFDPSQSN
jgi:peptidoglycan-associated lipoprotein